MPILFRQRRAVKIPALLAFPLLAFASLAAREGHARWATPEDVESKVVARDVIVDVDADGSYEENSTEELEITRESGRTNRGIARFTYNSDSASIEILQAYTQNGEKRTPVPLNLIEDKPLASSGSGFDQHHQVMVAFPEVSVGSHLFTQVRLKYRKVPVPGFYGATLDFNAEYLLKGRYEILSAIPLALETQDTDKYLDVKRSERKGDARPYRVEVTLRRPIYRQAIDEEDLLLHPTRYPIVWVATSKKWADTAPPVIVADYEKIVDSPLPPAYATIAKRAARETDPTAKINAVIAGLAEEVRYLGDWRSIRGRFVPRPLETIASTRYGDCKDFAASTAAILRHAGLEGAQVDVAWVKRGWEPVVDSYSMPSNYLFNHAIVYLKSGDRTWWLDPTNVAAFAQGTPKDIIDRPALVLDPKGAHLERIPPQRPEDSRHLSIREITFGEPGADLKVSGSYHVEGQGAAQWIFWSFSTPQETIDRRLAFNLARTDQIHDWKVEGFKLNQRVVKPLDATFSYVESRTGFPTSAGIAYPLPNLETLDRMLVPTRNRVSDLYLDQPYTSNRETVLRNIEAVGSESLDCQIESPWVTAKRSVSRGPASLKVSDQLVLKRSLVSNEEIQSPAFAELQKKIRGCFRNAAVVYQPRKNEKP